ncbi:hypothetical protein SDC9_136233 [bioreactor metagenome]|uniref:Uncharacterized protein n=1 Tax=bioreactor metagenome TaxID=1076179 RepID=A0A645DIR0_9ZZZZ
MLFWVGQSRPNLGGVVLFRQRAGGTGNDALAAGHAVHLGQVPVEGAADVGSEAPVVGADDSDVLHLAAHGGAAAAQDALGIIADEVIGRGLGLSRGGLPEAHGFNAEFGRQLLQLAAAAAGAGEALHPVVGENQLQRHGAGAAHGLGVGLHLQPLADGVGAGGHQAAGALDLHHADAAGADFVDVLQKAQGRDAHAYAPGGLQQAHALRGGHVHAVELEMNCFHCFVLPHALIIAPKRQRSMQSPHLRQAF